MSAARAQFLKDIRGLRDALQLDPIASGAAAIVDPPAVTILRRGVSVTALIALEAFVRERTRELLSDLSNWPAQYGQLPQKFREAALLHSLGHLQRYAQMLRRQKEDFEREIRTELTLM